MIYAFAYLVGTGLCMKSAKTAQGFNRGALYVFATTFAACGLLALASLGGAL